MTYTHVTTMWLSLLSLTFLSALADDCGQSRSPEVMILQDSTRSFRDLIAPTLAALPDFVDKLFEKYPTSRVGFMGFGDKTSSRDSKKGKSSSSNAAMFQLPQTLTSDVDALKSALSSYDWQTITPNSDLPENSAEAACYAAGMGGFTPYNGDDADAVTRFVVVITDDEGHYSEKDNTAITDLATVAYSDLSIGYAGLSQISTCLQERGIKLVVLVTNDNVKWWKEFLPKLGFDDTNSAAVQMDTSMTDTAQYTDTLFTIMEEQVNSISCKQEEIIGTSTTSPEPSVVASETPTTEAPAVPGIVTSDTYDCCDLCLE
eukprot:Blabericola_migrator_1__13009@NODE_86_length_14718_cov_24_199236_g77_i0_p6_GENE_NODE_86_length_14718_cov_24_199236_g77_i0NODE_86_length_14718_cov_24_199236_g77_i0_p6_ORF_typecomplete_len317_score69_95Integrin_beta/PF00362_18/8_1e15VWA/PF00092_28/0_00028VWA_2/PF13519_6/0_05VWA_2/PF13519_6/1_6e04VWA_2/PF13519_6/3_4e03Ssl1/PF04056_14/0_11_NODE_86_length_14718_cov_24_199236_g77_i01232713277